MQIFKLVERREKTPCLRFSDCQFSFTGVDVSPWDYASVVIVRQQDNSLTLVRDAGLHK